MRKLSYSYIYFIGILVLFFIVIYIFLYLKSLYYNSLAEKALKKITIFELITFSKENYYLPLVVNISTDDSATSEYKRLDDLVVNKNIYAVVKVSDNYDSFVVIVKHKKGDKIFGIDSDFFKIRYRYSESGYVINIEDCPPAKTNHNDLRGWIYKRSLKVDIPLIQY